MKHAKLAYQRDLCTWESVVCYSDLEKSRRKAQEGLKKIAKKCMKISLFL